MDDFFFVSYSNVDGKDFARQFADRLVKTLPDVGVWLDAWELQPGTDWDEQIVTALQECAGLLFLMTPDSVHSKSECKREWTRALRYKKPIIPLLFDGEAEMPFRLEPRQYLDFTANDDQSMAALRDHIRWRSSPDGLLQRLRERLLDAERDLPRATNDRERVRIEADIAELEKEIAATQQVFANPADAAQKTQVRINSALERARKPVEPVHAESGTKFINPPPSSAPSWFQNRHVETELVGNFLKDPGLRMMTVVGRGGVGKTVMVCRLLKALEAGQLPDDLGPLSVDGILYLSPKGLRQVTFAHLFADLCKLLPSKTAELLDAVYRNPQGDTRAKMQALLNAFPQGRNVVLLDNFEEVIDSEAGKLHDAELEEALEALLELPQHGVKVIITTREAPQNLLLAQPGRQTRLNLDERLEPPFAKELLRERDADGSLGLKDAPDALLAEACERTRGYPRALEALAAILATDRSTTLQEILADTERLLPENVVEALVGEAFSSLDPTSQQVMQALAILAAPAPEGAVDYLLQPYLPGIDSAPVLRRLVNMLFVRRESGRFHLHQVDRSHAMERISAGQPADREVSPPPFTSFALLRRAGEYYRTIRTPRASWKSIEDLVPQLAEFEVRVAGEEYDAAASVLREIDFDYLMLWGQVRLTLDLHERLNGRLTDRDLMWASLMILGICYRRLGDYPRAIDYFEQSLAVAREIGDRQGEGNVLGNLANCYISLGDYPRAIDHHEQSLAVAREIGDRQGEGNALGNLGICFYSLGDYPRAIDHHEQSLAIAREIGDRQGEGNALGNLGICFYSLGDYPRAIDHHEQYLAIAREIGDRQGEGNVLGNLANCYFSLGDYPRAIDHHEQSLTVAHEIGHRFGESAALGNLGICYDSLGDYPRAIDYQEQMLAIAREIGDRYVEAAALVYLGDISRNIREFAQACGHYGKAIGIADETGNRENQNNARFGLAVTHLLAGDLVLARATVDAAREYDYPKNDAAVWTVTGIIRLRQGESKAASEAFSRGLAEADELLKKSGQNFSALETKGLALSGLALCEAERHLAAAQEAFRAAREITSAKGVVRNVLNLFDALALVDTDEILDPARKAAMGE